MTFRYKHKQPVRAHPPNQKEMMIMADSVLVVTLDDGSIIQLNEKGGGWEVWHMHGTADSHCIASSINPPDRHYDE